MTLLTGARVVEASSFVAGPLAGMTLAQMGAEVIRVDPIEGPADAGRWPLARSGKSLFWSGMNKGVKSVGIDFRSAAGQQLVTQLIAAPGPRSGLFVDNTIGRRFLSYDDVRSARADVVHVHIQGYPDGRAAMDYAVNPRFGVPMLTRPVDTDRPVNHVLPAWDIATGLLTVSSLLSGLLRRMDTGEGARIDLALADVAAAHVANLGWLAEAAERGHDRPRLGNHMFGAFGVDFVCKDERRVIAVAITRQQWRDLMAMTGTERIFELLADAHGADLDVEGVRFENRALIEAVLAPWFVRHTADEVATAAAGTRVMVGDFRSVHDVVESYRAGQESEVLTTVVQPNIGEVLTATSPVRVDSKYAAPMVAPDFGGDTEWAMTEVLGLTTREVGRLLRDDVIYVPDAFGSHE